MNSIQSKLRICTEIHSILIFKGTFHDSHYLLVLHAHYLDKAETIKVLPWLLQASPNTDKHNAKNNTLYIGLTIIKNVGNYCCLNSDQPTLNLGCLRHIGGGRGGALITELIMLN